MHVCLRFFAFFSSWCLSVTIHHKLTDFFLLWMQAAEDARAEVEKLKQHINTLSDTLTQQTRAHKEQQVRSLCSLVFPPLGSLFGLVLLFARARVRVCVFDSSSSDTKRESLYFSRSFIRMRQSLSLCECVCFTCDLCRSNRRRLQLIRSCTVGECRRCPNEAF